jgi:hypothetical protein
MDIGLIDPPQDAVLFMDMKISMIFRTWLPFIVVIQP